MFRFSWGAARCAGESEEFFEQGFELGEGELAGRVGEGGGRIRRHSAIRLETHGGNTNPLDRPASITVGAIQGQKDT